VPSQHTLHYLITGPHVSLAKLAIVPCGRKRIAAKFQQIIQAKKNLDVVCVSRLEKGKGQDLLIKAFARVNQQVPNTQLIIVGEGTFQKELEKLIINLKLSAHVKLIGRVPEALREISKASLCVFPSVWPMEGFGLVLIEAMALSKPVVAFNHGPGNEVIIDESTGLLAKSGDIKDLADKIINLLQNPALRQTLGTAGHRKFLQKYTIKKCTQQFSKVLNEAYTQNQARKLLKEIVIDVN
jgi:glycosyltransferase involved in cell wall biosynthesis